MIDITLEQLINSTDGLKKLSEKSLKARSAYIVGKLLKAADAEMTDFNSARMDLIKKYGEKDESGELKSDENGNVRIPPESLVEFNKELKDLLDTKVSINANKIDIAELENIEFTPGEMTQLEEFIEFDEE